MKAFLAGVADSVPVASVQKYLYVCNRKPWELEYYVPLKSYNDLQVYIDFGNIKPDLTDEDKAAYIVDLCNTGNQQEINYCQYIIGVKPDGTYYGVFTFNFTDEEMASFPSIFTLSFDFSLNGTIQRYFTQGYRIETCVGLLKVEACFPSINTSYVSLSVDTNNIYYGPTADAGDSLGNILLRYNHFVYVRTAKICEEVPKITFSANNLFQNFKTILDRIFELRCELVPAWYKEYLLAIYTRGFIKIDGVTVYQVTDLTFEGIDDEDFTWKPYAKLKQENRQYFGCDDTPCDSACCAPCNVSATVRNVPDPCCVPTEVSATSHLPVIGGEVFGQCDPASNQILTFLFDNPTPAGLTLYLAVDWWDGTGWQEWGGDFIVPATGIPITGGEDTPYHLDIPTGVLNYRNSTDPTNFHDTIPILHVGGLDPFSPMPCLVSTGTSSHPSTLYIKIQTPSGYLAEFTSAIPNCSIVNL